MMITRQIDLGTVLDTLQGLELRQREIQDYLLHGEALPRPLLASMQDIENELRLIRHEMS